MSNEQLSKCCQSSMVVHTGGEGTSYYVCQACLKDCDPLPTPEQDSQTINDIENYLEPKLTGNHLYYAMELIKAYCAERERLAELRGQISVLEKVWGGLEGEPMISLANGQEQTVIGFLVELKAELQQQSSSQEVHEQTSQD